MVFHTRSSIHFVDSEIELAESIDDDVGDDSMVRGWLKSELCTHIFQMTGRVRTNIGRGQIRPSNSQHQPRHRRVRIHSGSRVGVGQF